MMTTHPWQRPLLALVLFGPNLGCNALLDIELHGSRPALDASVDASSAQHATTDAAVGDADAGTADLGENTPSGPRSGDASTASATTPSPDETAANPDGGSLSTTAAVDTGNRTVFETGSSESSMFTSSETTSEPIIVDPGVQRDRDAQGTGCEHTLNSTEAASYCHVTANGINGHQDMLGMPVPHAGDLHLWVHWYGNSVAGWSVIYDNQSAESQNGRGLQFNLFVHKSNGPLPTLPDEGTQDDNPDWLRVASNRDCDPAACAGPTDFVYDSVQPVDAVMVEWFDRWVPGGETTDTYLYTDRFYVSRPH